MILADEHDRPALSPDALRQEQMRSWRRWLPKGLGIGIVLSAIITIALRGVVEDWVRQALMVTASVNACVVDWSRWREVRWWVYARTVAAILVVELVLMYLMR